MSKERATAYFYLLLVAIIWGAAGPVIKYTFNWMPPLIFLTYRFTLTSILGLAYFAFFPKKLPNHSWFGIGLYGILRVTLALGLLFEGIDHTSSLSGTVISSVAPLFVALGGMLFLREKIERNEMIGIALAIIGTIISIAAPVLAAESANLTPTINGNFIVFLSMICDTAAILMAKVLLTRKIDATALTYIIFGIGFVTMLPITLLRYSLFEIWNTILTAPWQAHLGVLYMTFVSGLFAYTLNHLGLKKIEAGEATVFSYLSPIFAAPLALFWLGETITPSFILGSILIAAGVFFAEYRRRTKSKRRHLRR